MKLHNRLIQINNVHGQARGDLYVRYIGDLINVREIEWYFVSRVGLYRSSLEVSSPTTPLRIIMSFSQRVRNSLQRRM